MAKKIIVNGYDICYKSPDDASDLDYSNISSGLQATNTQAAIDELDGKIDNLTQNINSIVVVSSLPSSPSSNTLYLVTS